MPDCCCKACNAASKRALKSFSSNSRPFSSRKKRIRSRGVPNVSYSFATDIKSLASFGVDEVTSNSPSFDSPTVMVLANRSSSSRTILPISAGGFAFRRGASSAGGAAAAFLRLGFFLSDRLGGSRAGGAASEPNSSAPPSHTLTASVVMPIGSTSYALRSIVPPAGRRQPLMPDAPAGLRCRSPRGSPYRAS